MNQYMMRHVHTNETMFIYAEKKWKAFEMAFAAMRKDGEDNEIQLLRCVKDWNAEDEEYITLMEMLFDAGLKWNFKHGKGKSLHEMRHLAESLNLDVDEYIQNYLNSYIPDPKEIK